MVRNPVAPEPVWDASPAPVDVRQRTSAGFLRLLGTAMVADQVSQGDAVAGALSVTFWGVRGSMPATGTEFARFGGNTPCIEVRLGERLVIVDAGTGLGHLGVAIRESAPAEIDILLSHLHLDHVLGLPFFKPALDPKRTIRLHCGNLDGETAQAPLERLFSPPIFPVTLDKLPATIAHHGFRAGETITLPGGLKVDTIPLNHPSGATGFRLSHAGRVFVYLSDLEHRDPWPDPGLVAFARDADLVVFDAMFSDAEYLPCAGWGHSTRSAGIALARAAHVRDFAIFHLHPLHTDSVLEAVDSEVKAQYPGAFVAREGQRLVYPARA